MIRRVYKKHDHSHPHEIMLKFFLLYTSQALAEITSVGPIYFTRESRNHFYK